MKASAEIFVLKNGYVIKFQNYTELRDSREKDVVAKTLDEVKEILEKNLVPTE